MSDSTRIFAQRWGASEALMRSPPETHLNYTVGQIEDPSKYSGDISSLRITYNGKWGNYVYQLVNMFFIAKRLGATNLILKPTEIFPLETEVQTIDGINVWNENLAANYPGPTLSGVFMDASPLGPLSGPISTEDRKGIARRYIRPLMSRMPWVSDNISEADFVLHIRSGDIFYGAAGASQTGGNLYVQPPAAAYIKAVERAFSEGSRHVVLIAENMMNPTIAVILDALSVRRIPFTLRINQSLETDLLWMMSARKLMVSNGTLGIAVANLSPFLKEAYFFGFNCTGTSLHIDRYLGDDLRKTVLLDAGGGYIPIGGWRNTPEQHEIMKHYPADALAWHDQVMAVSAEDPGVRQ